MWCWWKGAWAPRPAARKPATSAPLHGTTLDTPRSRRQRQRSNARDYQTLTDQKAVAFQRRRLTDKTGNTINTDDRTGRKG